MKIGSFTGEPKRGNGIRILSDEDITNGQSVVLDDSFVVVEFDEYISNGKATPIQINYEYTRTLQNN